MTEDSRGQLKVFLAGLGYPEGETRSLQEGADAMTPEEAAETLASMQSVAVTVRRLKASRKARRESVGHDPDFGVSDEAKEHRARYEKAKASIKERAAAHRARTGSQED